MSGSAAAPVRAAQLYGELESLLREVGEAVVQGDVQRVADLVPQQEMLLRQIAEIPLSGSEDPDDLLQLQDAAARAMLQNTRNSILLREQLAFIQETMRALVGDRNAVDRLA